MTLKVVFMGTPQFAVPALKKICESEIDIVAVYSQPPRKSNRGMKIEKSPVHEFADNNNLNIRTPSKLDNDWEYFKSLTFDLAIVVAYGQIILKNFLEIPEHGFLNIHASILPKWRGAAPIQRSIMEQDTFTGISIMQIEEQLDAGPVLIKQEIELNENSTTGQVEQNLSEIGADKILEAIHLVEKKEAVYIPQDDNAATYAKKIKKEDETIDWSRDAKAIIAQINGLNPRPGAYFEYRGEKIKIWKASYGSGEGEPGTVMNDNLQIACGKGSISVKEIQRPGKKIQPIKIFLLGFAIPESTQLK
ncbi:methionyl-tRNA formyltransferase [Candidatus Pelagibacter sp. IMCC9063]|uniref:methionyl-tRNA formyltransferase n=1 Tax=Pelagibacter sp. (strain IMCC9063) TaxID=1002672 RepID=UPI0002046887|nr:methionyl-tRNA formyltransferase [Candidatus Pelagibacter sp. IMCC9063]AEA81015.1 methionyl-tRNA formyltransferase [Candidatus Pelagibacter sp. IMCC9063]